MTSAILKDFENASPRLNPLSYGTFSFKPADFTDTILRICPSAYLYKSHRVLYGNEWENNIKFDIKHIFSATTFFL